MRRATWTSADWLAYSGREICSAWYAAYCIEMADLCRALELGAL